MDFFDMHICAKPIPPERLALLTELGFSDRAPDCDPTYAFRQYPLALDTRMLVQGDHATDIAYVYYARPELDGEVLDGFFFAPSIVEYLQTEYGGRWNPDALLQKMVEQSDVWARFVFIGGVPMFFIEIDEYSWQSKDLHTEFSDMLKLVAVSDYLLMGELQRLRAEEN